MVLVRRGHGAWHEPESSSFENEKALQKLVKVSPSLLPGGEQLAVVAELWIPAVGFVDLIGIGADGKVIIVECKLRANPEIRREVIGQVLSYAGGLWRMTYDEFDAAFAARAGTSMYEAVKQSTATELEESQFREAVKANLSSGSFRLVVAIDEITAELRTIVEFLNDHTVPTVQIVALELRYSRDGDVELLIPVVYGEEAAEKKSRASSAARWNETTFAEAIKVRATPEAAAFLNRVIAHGQRHGHHLFYGSGATPGMSCFYSIGGVPTSVWAIYLQENGPRLALSLGSIRSKVSADAAMKWVNEMRTDPALNELLASTSVEDLHKYPQLPVSSLLDPSTQDAFLASLDIVRS